MKIFGVLLVCLVMVFASAFQQDFKVAGADAAFTTGLKYLHGDGVTQNYAEALKW